MLSQSSEFKPELLYMKCYDAIQELKVIYYCLIYSSIMNTQVDSYLLNFRRTEGHFVPFNILRHNYLMNLDDRVSWFSEKIQ